MEPTLNERKHETDPPAGSTEAPDAYCRRVSTEILAREQAEIFAARRASNDESDRLRTFLKDCRCPCCDARARLRALSYERAYNSAAPVHCASTDRRDPATLVRGSDEERLAADAAAAEKEFRSAIQCARESAYSGS